MTRHALEGAASCDALLCQCLRVVLHPLQHLVTDRQDVHQPLLMLGSAAVLQAKSFSQTMYPKTIPPNHAPTTHHARLCACAQVHVILGVLISARALTSTSTGPMVCKPQCMCIPPKHQARSHVRPKLPNLSSPPGCSAAAAAAAAAGPSCAHGFTRYSKRCTVLCCGGRQCGGGLHGWSAAHVGL